MSRFYVPGDSVKGNEISVTGKEAHHILNVMRLKVSDSVVVFDGTGNEYTGVVKEAGHRSLSIEIVRTRKAPRVETHRITLIQAIPKKEKMDYIVEKATELGVSAIIPVTTARTIPDWNEEKRSSIVERWKKISQAAAKQCGRVDVPVVSPIMLFRDCLPAGQAGFGPSGLAMTKREEPAMTDSDRGLKLMAALSDKAISLKEVLKSSRPQEVVVAVGPEGDFTPEEIDAAVKAGFKIVTLGPRVLKSDTAGLAVLSMINYEYED